MTKGLWRSDAPPYGTHWVRRSHNGGFEWLDERWTLHDGGPCPVDPEAMVVWWLLCDAESAPAEASLLPWNSFRDTYYRIVSSTERAPEAEKPGAVPPAATRTVSVDPNAKMIERDLVEPIIKATTKPATKPVRRSFPVSSDDLSRQGWLLGGTFWRDD